MNLLKIIFPLIISIFLFEGFIEKDMVINKKFTRELFARNIVENTFKGFRQYIAIKCISDESKEDTLILTNLDIRDCMLKYRQYKLGDAVRLIYHIVLNEKSLMLSKEEFAFLSKPYTNCSNCKLQSIHTLTENTIKYFNGSMYFNYSSEDYSEREYVYNLLFYNYILVIPSEFSSQSQIQIGYNPDITDSILNYYLCYQGN